MSSYLSNLLTTTTSRYNSLRRNLLSEETDGDTEDDSHISRVLRAYYVETGRPFPPWLPPDPKAPQSAPVQQFARSSAPQAASPAPGSRAGLSDLWDSPAQQAPPAQPMSLRSRGQPQPRPGTGGGRGGFLQTEPAAAAQGRPLPSQRAGSYQSAHSQASRPSFDGTSSGGGSAQERLKARLWGGSRSGSPGPSPGSGSPGQRPNPFDRSQNSSPQAYGGGGGGGGGAYDTAGGGYSRPGRIGLPSGPRPNR
ncbi:uncharacterized protein K452DRAFT_309761 [Aplosporella prunicola CBS 121167]|uniref:Mso1 N-terminal domain-containing protein n=1 Tax=Aplosporella prunicola CBS 121167 TaxID=1176127 RepID=A0A6A6BBI9_9PEZI|nr:uncharacterized protein K452DRAFT_309761 [Aplosporella prunicola CBS 121167]KAF2140634.1 hypothetical protein K452DRAFT_309761 [Aplosporella prunicola CBS 121167]